MKRKLTQFAEQALKQLKQESDYETQRDICDLVSGGELDPTQLDILVDMVRTRLLRFAMQEGV
jgi:hypothetical protein